MDAETSPAKGTAASPAKGAATSLEKVAVTIFYGFQVYLNSFATTIPNQLIFNTMYPTSKLSFSPYPLHYSTSHTVFLCNFLTHSTL